MGVGIMVEIVTNHVPRDVVDGWELTAAERAEFDYVDWPAVDAGEERAEFFRYRGELHDLGEFTTDYGITSGSGLPDSLAEWDGYRSDTFFSGMVVKLVDGGARVIVGRVIT